MPAEAYDYYEELGVPESANYADLKKAFRAASLKWHPDRNRENPQAEERFKRANEAYQVLSDPQQRAKYDLERNMPSIGIDWETGQFDPSKINFTEDAFVSAFVKVFGDFLDDKAPGARSKINDHIKEKKSKKKKKKASKTSPKPSARPCKVCGGTGKVRLKQGKMKLWVICKACKGSRVQQSP